MKQSKSPPPAPIDDETLVAYLDGELSSELSSSVEQSVQAEPELRKRLAQLQASWDLLSDLPVAAPRRDLTQSTIEMVTVSLDQNSPGWRAWFAKNRIVALALAGAVMIIAGAASSRALTSYLTRQILSNLPIIVNLPALKNIDSPEFLRELSRIENLVAAAGPQAARGLIGDGRVPLEIGERRTWVEQLQEDGRGRLENNLVDYHQLSELEEKSLRSITLEIYADPARSDNYLEVIRAYNAILERWGSKPRAILQKFTLLERIEVIRDRVAVLMALNYVPTAEDRDVLSRWLESIVQKQESSEQLFYYTYDAERIVRDLLWADADNSVVTDEDLEELLQMNLSPQAVQRLTDIGSEPEQRQLLGMWIEPFVSGSPERSANANLDLEERFNSYDSKRQNSLEFLPEEEVRRILRQSTTATQMPPNPPL